MPTRKNYLIEAALATAEQGLPVFPTNQKMPAWSNADLGVAKGEGGYKAASTDPDRVRELFAHPRAKEIAVPMGERSGLMCVDVDIDKGPEVEQWHEDNLSWLSETRCHKTRSGGRHYLFKHVAGVRFPATLAFGVDLKAAGNGYVCWPGTDGYEVVDDAPPSRFPLDKLGEAAREKDGSLKSSSWNSASDEELIAAVASGESYHPALRSLSVRLAQRRVDIEQATKTLYYLMDENQPADGAELDRWGDRRAKIPDLIESAYDRYGIIQEASAADRDLILQGRSLMPEVAVNFAKPSLAEMREEVTAEKQPAPDAPNMPLGLVGEIAQYHDSKSRHVTPQYGIMCGLTAVSALLANRYVVDMPKYDTNTNLFIVGIGPTGSGKELPRTIIQEVLTIADMQDTVKDVVSEPAFHAALCGDPRMTWLPDEFGKMLRNLSSSAGHHAAGVLKFSMQAYGLQHGGMVPAKFYSNAKDAKPAVVSPYVVTLATTTRTSFSEAMNTDFISDGFLNRLLMVEEDQDVMGKINGSGKARLSTDTQDRIRALADNGALEVARLEGKTFPNPLPIKVTPDALAVFDAFDAETTTVLAQTNDRTKQELMPRVHENAIRVAGVLACGDSDPLAPVLTVDHANWAVGFVQCSLARMMAFALDMGGSDFDKNRIRVLEFISAHGDEGVLGRDISRKFHLPARQREEVMEHLEHAGYVHTSEETRGTSQQPVEVYRAV